MAKLTIKKDEFSTPNYSIPFSDNGFKIKFLATETATVTVPANKTIASIQVTPGAEVWVGYNLAPVVPTNNTPASSNGMEMLPAVRNVTAADTLQFVAVDAANVNVVFYED